jgi:EmrB/QacA subfamily drug resistance transporter
MSLDLLRPGASRTAALVTLCAMQLMIILDGSIVTVALPTIQRDLGFSPAGLAWVVNAYLVTFAGLLLLSGRLGDRIGSARVFQAGLVVFTLASLLCGLAATPGLLVAGRCLQGAGGALAAAVILGMIVRLYPEPSGQARGIGVYSFVSAAGAAIGLLSGGVLTQALGWQADFFVNVPIGILALVAAGRLFTRLRPADDGKGADIVGGILVTASLSLGVLAILRATDIGWGATESVLSSAAAVSLLALFLRRQATAPSPMLPLRIFRRRQVTVGNLASVFLFAAGFGFQYLTALYLQRVLGYDALHTGLAFLPVPLVIGGISLAVTARLIAGYGIRWVLLRGLALVAAGMGLLSRTPVDGRYLTDVLPIMVVLGLGMGLALPGVTVAAMSGADPGEAGLASGLVNTTQQAGAAVGLAVLASVAAGRTAGQLNHGVGQLVALRNGYSLGYAVAAGFVIVALLVASALPPPPRTKSRPSGREHGLPTPPEGKPLPVRGQL